MTTEHFLKSIPIYSNGRLRGKSITEDVGVSDTLALNSLAERS